jgi:hypothetical protein
MTRLVLEETLTLEASLVEMKSEVKGEAKHTSAAKKDDKKTYT